MSPGAHTPCRHGDADVSDADVSLREEVLHEALDRWVRGTAEVSRNQYRAFLADLPRRDTAPAYQVLLIDAADNLWVSTLDYSARDRGTGGPEWYVFDPSGTWLEIVSMPAHLKPMDIGDDWVLGVHTDDMDVQRVRLYKLMK